MAKSPVEVWLWLLLVMQPYNPKTIEILSQCGGDAAAGSRMIRDGNIPFLNDKEKLRAKEVRMGAIKPIVELCRENDVHIVTLDDDEYPVLLRNICNPPILLFVAGTLDGFDKRPAVAAVGARNISEYGASAAQSVIAPLAKTGVSIVSGMAVGADAAAHRAALSVGGYTAGVLGCGIMVNYPAENAELKREIVKKGGALISELLPDTRTFGRYFPARNRIISGLCHGTLVIEASGHSGSLLTANHAVSQNRDVFCIPPHDIMSARYEGVAPLIRDGATCVFGYTDILAQLMQTYSGSELIRGMLDNNDGGSAARTEEPISAADNARKDRAPKPEERPAGSKKPKPIDELLSALESNDTAVLKLIAEQPATADELVEKSDLDFSAVSEALTNLELLGHISREMDGVYSVSAN